MDQTRIVIEAISPVIDAGRHPIKAVVGDRVPVGADIWKDGHERLRAAVFWRRLSREEQIPLAPAGPPDLTRSGWREAPLESRFEDNDRWSGSLEVSEPGAHVFAVGAWTDEFASFREDLKKRVDAGQRVPLEVLEGLAVLGHYHAAAQGADRAALGAAIDHIRAVGDETAQVSRFLDPALLELCHRNDPRADLQLCPLEIPLWVDRERGRTGAWYELFVRSQGTTPGRSATFREAEARLPAIGAMGFDVLYLAPIHPIGHAFRKGKNNSVTCQPGDPGSPWAVGNEHGGHTAIHPELGTLDDFDHYVDAARRLGMEIALDFAIQCSPDHPWVKQHPSWFEHRPDGTIRYAENPPKKYQDVYPLDFDTADRDGLYAAMLDVVRFWIGHGVRIFRVDNPHTKAISFWEWLIGTVHRDHPDVLFLAEAFTRPKRMRKLAKVGYTQSYTYFTWRNSRVELEEYARELFQGESRLYLRPNFFANTPDILHEYLQHGGRPAFLIRLVLAATMSPTYGIYSGFELCENVPVRPGSEEYLDSEKYEVRVRDWERPGNIVPIVARVNRARREHRALQLLDNLEILESSNPSIIAYAKVTPDRRDRVVVVVSTNPHSVEEGTVRVPNHVHEAGGGEYKVVDRLTDATYTWRGDWNYVRLDPRNAIPAHLLHLPRR